MIFQPPGGLGSHYDDLASGVLRQNERPLTVRVSKLGLGKKTTFHVFPTICYHRIIYFCLVGSKLPSRCSVSYCFCILPEVFSHSKLLCSMGKKIPRTPLNLHINSKQNFAFLF